MALNIKWQSSNGGSEYADPLNHGTNLAQGDTTGERTIFLSHDGINEITNVGIYLQAFTGDGSANAYVDAGGDHTRDEDLAEIIGWGDAGSAPDWGGVMINQNATGGFPDASWSVFANKSTVDTYGENFRTGVGDTISAPIEILAVTGATSDGTIQPGSSPDVSFQMRILVPSTASISGLHLFDTVIVYDFTS